MTVNAESETQETPMDNSMDAGSMDNSMDTENKSDDDDGPIAYRTRSKPGNSNDNLR